MKQIMLIPDKSFFIILNKIKVDLTLLEEIEKNLGFIILDEKNHLELLSTIKKDPNVINFLLWKYNLDQYNQNYFDILNDIACTLKIKYHNIKEKIDVSTKTIYKIIKQFNNGISIFDAQLYGLSYVIRNLTNYEPIIISDDLDINLHGNFLSSYFGFSLLQLSSYELLRPFYSQFNILEDYVKEIDIENFKVYPFNNKIKKGKYEPELKKLFSKCLLSLNPKIENDRQYKIIIRK